MQTDEIVDARRAKLYGPHREVTRQHCKSICTKDSVREALQKGEYGGDSDYVWLTSAQESYKGERKSDDIKCEPQSRDTTNFVLGFDKVRYLTTTGDYKLHDVTHKPKRTQVDERSHIPDFCPEYAECRKTRPSEYQVSFTLDLNHPMSTSKTSEKRKKHGEDLRSTHFRFGSCSDSKTSETRHSFTEVKKSHEEQSVVSGASERSKSTVFRPGDWNNNDRKLLAKSVTQKDFCQCNDLKPDVGIQTPSTYYHRKTHFQLGSANNNNNSTYDKDFKTSPNLATCKPALATEPTPAMVFPNEINTSYESTLQSTFGNNDRDLMLSLKNERKANFEENKSRQIQNSVPISFKKEKPIGVDKTLMSTTTCHFHQPLLAECNKPFNGIPEYNHLTSDYKGSETKQSETKASYLVSPIASKQLRRECNERGKANKSTHFVFGTYDLNDTVTEQASQYRQHLPLDPSLQPAGKIIPQKKTYHHIDAIGGQYNPSQFSQQPESNSRKMLFTSVMKRDYKPVVEQRLTDKVSMKTADTHFFHMDDEFKGTQNSTTKTDFLSPELMFKLDS